MFARVRLDVVKETYCFDTRFRLGSRVSCSTVGIPAAVAGVDLVISSCLRRLGPVVPERRPERPRYEPGEIPEDTKLSSIDNLNITHHIFFFIQLRLAPIKSNQSNYYYNWRCFFDLAPQVFKHGK